MRGAGALRRIAERRRQRVRREGHGLGCAVPRKRQVPIVPFGPSLRAPAGHLNPVSRSLVCEIKRRSPSAGEIAPSLDPLSQADLYVRAGASQLSILTEIDHFGGCLEDLITVKRSHPELGVLRKDFLLDLEDLEVSFRCGADAVLLIAALHDAGTLSRLCRRAEALGLTALVEVHDLEDLDKARQARPTLTGINSRDLATFRVDRLAPLGLRGRVDWETRLVYESGVRSGEDARVARDAGFDAVLVGEAVVRRPSLVSELLEALGGPAAAPGCSFWGRLAARLAAHRSAQPGSVRPLVKICGLTRPADAERAAALGADLLGFVFADSPRRADPGLLRDLRDLPALKVGVAVSEEGTRLQELVAEGLLDAVQLHGEEAPERCASLAFPYFKALRLRHPGDAESAVRYRCPRVLADAWAPEARGGTGRQIADDLVESVAAQGPLWLAGGLGPDNVGGVVRRHRPELVDASSGLELRPGEKDPERLGAYFEQITIAAEAAAGGRR